jgi:hypothetical protein
MRTIFSSYGQTLRAPDRQSKPDGSDVSLDFHLWVWIRFFTRLNIFTGRFSVHPTLGLSPLPPCKQSDEFIRAMTGKLVLKMFAALTVSDKMNIDRIYRECHESQNLQSVRHLQNRTYTILGPKETSREKNYIEQKIQNYESIICPNHAGPHFVPMKQWDQTKTDHTMNSNKGPRSRSRRNGSGHSMIMVTSWRRKRRNRIGRSSTRGGHRAGRTRAGGPLSPRGPPRRRPRQCGGGCRSTALGTRRTPTQRPWPPRSRSPPSSRTRGRRRWG